MMEIVQSFNAELSSLYEVRPPISKAKMSQITRVSMKAVKMYKHIVQSVERFIVKCRPEYKIPGLYVIDSIVRQSRHQFGVDKDVYAARFARNFASTFQNLFLTCPPDDKPKIVRVLNLWQRNNVFSAETIQPLLDMANPNASLSQMTFEGSPQTSSATRETSRDNRESNSTVKDANLMHQLQQLANSLGLGKSGNSSSANYNLTESQQMETQNTIKFNKKLLDFDYGDEEDDDERGETPTEAEPPLRSGGIVDDSNVTNPLALSMAQNLLSNPELLQQLQQMHKTIQQTELLKLSISELESHGMVTDINPAILNQSAGQQFLNQFNQSQQSSQSITINESNDDTNQNKRNEIINAFENSMETKLNIDNNIAINENNFQYLQNANFVASQSRVNDLNFAPNNSIDAQKYHQQQQFHQQFHQEINEMSGSQSPRSRSPRRSRFNRYRERSRSRSRNRRDRERDSRRSYRSSRSRSPQQSRNSRFDSSRNNERSRSPASYERDRERERRRRGLPPIRKGCLTICSTTLWLGHVPKLASEADLSDSFGEFGTITSIDLIPPRGCAYVCMNRRQDASKALSVMRNMKLHGSIIKMAWAPGKGMKGKEYKDYWEAENGASYIPYNRIPDDVDLDLLEEGGTVDEDTVPEKLQELRKIKNKEREEKEREVAANLMARATLIPMPLVSIPTSSFNVSTGLVMPTNMIFTQTGQTSALTMHTTSETPVTSIMTGVTQNYSHLTSSVPSLSLANDDINNQLMDMNDVQSNADTILQINESQQSEPLLPSHPSMPSPNASLLPPPLPPFQPPPLGIPPPPIIGGQPPPRLPWLTAPPHTMGTALNASSIHSGQRIPVNAGAIRAPLLPSSSALTSPTSSSSFRSEDISIGPTLSKPEDRPPLIATLPIPLHHEELSNLHELPPRLHQDRNFSGRERFRPNADMERHRSNEDPFAPSVYELRAMERNSIMRPPIPHQMHSGASGMRPMMPQNMNERFPFDNRPQRQFHPRQQHHHNIRPNMHSNYDRHGNLRNTNRGGRGRDHYSGDGAGGGRGNNFNRRDRPSRWKNDERDRDRHFNRGNDFHYNKQKYQHNQQNEDNNDVNDSVILNNSNNNNNNNNNDSNMINNDINASNFGDSDNTSETSDLKSNANDSSFEQLESTTQNLQNESQEADTANSLSNT